jgi:hypothetical protein
LEAAQRDGSALSALQDEWPPLVAARVLSSFELSRVGRNDTFLEDEAAIEATFAGLYHAIGFFREFIEGKSLDRTHWRRAALRSVDLGLHVDLHGWNLIGLADDFHSQSGLVDKGIEWQD